MNRRHLLRRVGFAILSVYVALSAMFMLVTFAPNTAVEGQVGSAALANPDMTTEELQELRRTILEARGLDRPIHVRYGGWLVDMTTLRWGVSYSLNAPVRALVADRMARTLAYALPGFVLAVILGVGGGMYAAAREGAPGERLLRTGAYLVFGMPNFWLAAVAVVVLSAPPVIAIYDAPPIIYQRVVPALLIASTLLAGQLSYTRSESLEQIGREYIRFLRAKGLGPFAIARRVFRNAAVPLVTVFFTDLLAIFVIAIYVIEFALGIPGIGRLTYDAAIERDMPLLLGATLVVVVMGVLGNLIQDLTYASVDPRTGEGER